MGAADGLEALARLRQEQRPGVILLDLAMPNMDGVAFRRHQLDDPGLADIPVVVCSGESGGEQTALRLGTDGYLTKPLDADCVLDVVHRFCP
jgi:CheY-like chemotaxis protein